MNHSGQPVETEKDVAPQLDAKILIVEDSADEAKLLRRTLEERSAALSKVVVEAQQKAEPVKLLFEHNADGIIVINPDGRIRLANPAAAQILGHRADDLQGMDYGMPVVPGEFTELDVPCSNGGIKNVEMHSAEILWEGQPAHLVSLRGITQRKQVEVTIAQQILEPNRWNKVVEGVESRIGDLKHQVNELQSDKLE